MKRRHNLGTVIRFEYVRTIKKKSFWIATLAMPLLIAAVFGIAYYSGMSSSKSSEKLAKEEFSIAYLDKSDIISDKLASQLGAKQVNDRQKAIDKVKSHKLDAFFYYPENLSKDTVQIYAKDVGLFKNNRYSAVADNLMSTSASLKINDPSLLSVIKNKTQVDTTTYKDNGEKSAGWMAAGPPLIFLAAFYLIIILLGSNLLNSTVEEKENRVTEMILTTLNPTNLILGKIVATLMAGITQILVLAVPIIGAYIILGNDAYIASLPDLSVINNLVFDPVTMTIGALLFIGGMMLFTGTLVAVGAIMPTAKEAGQYFGITILMMFIPFYIIPLILSNPSALIVQVFTYFPFTAPITAIFRNAFGSLSTTEAIIIITELIVLGIIIIKLAVKLFKYGAMQYSSKLSLKTVFSKKYN